MFFFFNDTATTEIYTLSLHDALPICPAGPYGAGINVAAALVVLGLATSFLPSGTPAAKDIEASAEPRYEDRKSTRLNSSHANISYAVFCLKKKNTSLKQISTNRPSTA